VGLGFRAVGYDVYTSPFPAAAKKLRTKVNKNLITSGTHFAYMWNTEKGERIRKIKGYRHYLSVTAVCSSGSGRVPSAFSEEKDNFYFKGFHKIEHRDALLRILRHSQTTPYLPVGATINNASKFSQFMEGPRVRFNVKFVNGSIRSRKGAAHPIATVVVQLMLEWGLQAFRVEGTFIKEFHAFVVLNVDSVEYIVDFAADQFIPDVSPVVLPRDMAYLDENGKFSANGTPVYRNRPDLPAGPGESHRCSRSREI